MSNFDSGDIHRSLRRLVWLALPQEEDGWPVRTERQVVADDERPAAVVEPSSAITTVRARSAVPQGNVAKLQSFSVMAYPAIEKTARQSLALAQAVVSALDQALTLGLVDSESGVAISGPMMVPIFDFGGVPVTGRDREGPREPYGFADVDDLAVRPLQDPLDYLRYTVTCDLRLSWEQGGRIVDGAPTAASVLGRFNRVRP